jgi:fatty-acyl-CoA synthase
MSVSEAYVRPCETVQFFNWCVGDLLRDAVSQAPQRLALVSPATPDGRPERTWTYLELLSASEQAARALLQQFKPGDRIATLAGATPEIFFLQLGAALAGIILVTLNPASRSTELEYLLAQCEARGIFLDRIYRKIDNEAALQSIAASLPKLECKVFMDEWAAFIGSAAECLLPVVAADSPVLLLFTSGTTGKPKGVVLRHRGVVNNARFSTQRVKLESGSTWLNVLPMFHVGGSVTIALGCMSNIGTQIMLTDFTAEAALHTLETYRVTVTMAVPTMLHAMLRSERFAGTDLSHLKVVVTGGTVVAPELVREVEGQFKVEVMVMFGQTEAGGCMCLTRRGDSVELVTQSVGAPLPLTELKITSAQNGAVLAFDEIGEICVRTPCAMIEYFRQPVATHETVDAEGWVHTGDLGSLRPDGYVQIKGRLKDMIIRGGENIYPREIEDWLAMHPAVSQAAVFGVPDEKWGEQVAAAVMLKPGASADGDALAAFLCERLARHKVPKSWRFVTAFPLNTSGKIQKFVLREQHDGGTVKP